MNSASKRLMCVSDQSWDLGSSLMLPSFRYLGSVFTSGEIEFGVLRCVRGLGFPQGPMPRNSGIRVLLPWASHYDVKERGLLQMSMLLLSL